MEEKIKKIEDEIILLKDRNLRVEADKAWETSIFRVISITVSTYIIAGIALYAIGNEYPLRNALIPALGYFLSTQSLPFLKKRWVKRNSV
ncbi:MAG: hypothetical protein WC835_01290 [Candidatus Paceibacterota bacterium]|jgi:hypothetical protein